MDLLVIFGFFAATLIGISLGLIGGGGSIITVPVLVYLMNVEPVIATAYSLFVVGSASLVGSIKYFQKGLVNIKTAAIFGLPAIITVYLMRKIVVPSIPVNLFEIANFMVTKDIAIMVIFAIAMILASVSMIKGRKDPGEVNKTQDFNFPLILLFGILVGSFTGFVGAGGGFLIIPALIVLAKLPMKQAVGTSLLIISSNSLIGFIGDATSREIDWRFLLLFTSIAVVGIFIGSALSNKIEGAKLKPAFGWFVLVMGILILGKSLIN
ncbi:MAG: sulfite exporter TauE/SafE family protein [Salibacteraceae bacterium]